MSDVSRRIASLSPEKRALLEQRLGSRMRDTTARPIAVIGLGCRFPGADSPEAFWQLLLEGRDAITEVPAERWDVRPLFDPDPGAPGKMASRWGGFLSGIDQFDADFFGIAPREADRMDPQQRLLLEITCEALARAGLPPNSLAGRHIGVFVGAHSMSSDYYLRQLRRLRDIDAYTSTGAAHSILANRLSYLLDLRGPSVVVDTACSSSLVAVHLACQSIRAGECDIAIAGGVNLMLSPEASVAFSKLRMMAADGRCKTFDASADGFVRGEGCGVVILRRLDRALEHNDPVLALVRGSAVNQDGATNGLTAPSGISQRDVIRAALQDADISPERITFVETHGTGTALGDPIEVEALGDVLGAGSSAPSCTLGAVKTNIGHLEAAAGIAGLIKVVLCLQGRYIPANLHFRSPNPHISLNGSRLTFALRGAAWESSPARSRIAGVSSFGFGGTNAHVLVEEFAPSEANAAPASIAANDTWLALPLSARSPQALNSLAQRWIEWLNAPDGLPAARDIAYTAGVRRDHYECRRLVIGRSAADWKEHLERLVNDGPGARAAPERVLRPWPGLVFVYSGQGPQAARMGLELYDASPVFRAALDRCDAEFRKYAAWLLLEELARSEASSRLQSTEIAQPAIFAIQYALTEVCREWGLAPDAVVGHSAGEVAAAWASGALGFEEAARLVVYRGRLMEQTAGHGAMAAVELPPHEALAAIEPFGDALEVAAVNSPTSSVLSGDPNTLRQAAAALKQRGVFVKPLGVNYAFHSRQMERLQPELRALLSDLTSVEPRTAMASSVTGRLVRGAGLDAAYWAQNMREPVRFADAVQTLAAAGHRVFLELSPHPILGSMLSRCGDVMACSTLRRGGGDVRAMLETAATLYELGATLNFARLQTGEARVVGLPSYPWERRRHWFGEAGGAPRADAEMQQGDDLYDVKWLPKTRLEDGPIRRADDLCRPGPIRHRMQAWRQWHVGSAEVPLVDVERISSLLALRGLRALSGDSDRILRTRVRQRLAPRRAVQRLLGCVIETLEREGMLEPVSDGWRVRGAVDDEPAEAMIDALRRSHPESEAVLQLLATCGREFAHVLEGARDPLSILFPEHDGPSAERIYTQSTFARHANSMLRCGIGAMLDNLPAGRPLRVLEIGAGTGATSVALLEVLPGDRTEYVFTDVSPRFLQLARRRFASSHPLVRYAVLDIERDPESQGFAASQFDVVVAANVMHATADVAQGLERVSRLLAPGGVFMLLEGIERRLWVDLTFGLTDGWWKFDEVEAPRDYPLLGTDGWRAALERAGFRDVEPVPVSGGDSLFPQAILVASTDRPFVPAHGLSPAAPDRRGTWCLFADSTGVSSTLSAMLAARGDRTVVVSPAARFGVHRDRVDIDPEQPDAFDRLVDTLTSDAAAPLQGCIHLWALDANPLDPTAAADLEGQQIRVFGSAIQFAGALARARVNLPAGLWLVSRGAESPDGVDRPVSIAQAPLWGAGRAIALECPDAWGGLIDLDATADGRTDAGAILREITRSDGEDQIALRGTARYVPRLVPARSVRNAAPTFRPDRAYLITGGSGGLGLQIASWMAEAGARWIVLASRRGLDERASGRRSQIERIRQLGTLLRSESVDVADRPALRRLLDGFGDTEPPLAGVVHAAGIVEMHGVAEMPTAAIRRVVAPKIAGAWNLHVLTREIDLDAFVVLSSAASVWGAAGLAHYAAANHFMEALTNERRRLGLPATCVNLGWWEGGGTTDEQHHLYGRIGLQMMPSADALHALGAVLDRGVTHGTLARVDWSRFAPVYNARRRRPLLDVIAEAGPGTDVDRVRDVPSSGVLDRLHAAGPEQAAALLESHVRAEVARVLGISSAEALESNRGFFELGMDSITSVELRGRLEAALQRPLPVTVALEYPNIRSLSDFLASELGLGGVSGGPHASRTRHVDDSAPEAADAYSEDQLASLLDRAIADAMGDVQEDRVE